MRAPIKYFQRRRRGDLSMSELPQEEIEEEKPEEKTDASPVVEEEEAAGTS